VVHGFSEKQTRYLGRRIAARLHKVGLRLHPDKTKIVYCQQDGREDSYERTSFTFLGYAFRARGAINSKNGGGFTSSRPRSVLRRSR